MINCRHCDQDLPIDRYYTHGDGRLRARTCKDCWNTVYVARARAKDPDLANGSQRRWREKKRLEDPEGLREIYRKSRIRRYGITVEQHDQMLANQDGVCAICGELCSSGLSLAVDHDHATGVVRGLLCGRCNKGLGSFRDRPDLLVGAAMYLLTAEQGDPLLRAID